jgi:hypothetical protein
VDQAWQLEQESWAAAASGEAAAFFAKVMTGDAFVVLPGRILERDDVIGRWADDLTPWRSYELGTPRLVLLDGDTVAVSYRVTASSDEEPDYRAQVTSMYTWVGGGWALAFRQHTPD